MPTASLMPAALKLVIVMPSGHPLGGAEESLLHLVKSRHAAGLELAVIFLEKGPLVDQVRAANGSATVIEAGRIRYLGQLLRTWWQLRRLIRAEQPTAVLSWMTKGHIYGGVAAWLAGVPAIYFQHGLPNSEWLDRISRRIPTAGALACSEFAARQQRPLVHYPVLPVPVAADLERFSEVLQIPTSEMKARLGFDAERPLVGIVGRLQHWKGMHIFAEAMSQVLVSRPDCQAVIVGGVHQIEPGYEAFLKSRIAELGLKDRIRLAGLQTQIPRWMQAMDVFVHASEREPFGIVVVEAMSLSKAVVATRPGGPEEIIQEGVNGILVPQGDATALANAILRFLNDRDFARTCGEAAWERARDFSMERFAKTLRLAVTQLLHQKTDCPLP